MTHIITKEEEKNIISDYLSGMNYKELIEKYHHNFYTIKTVIEKNKIEKPFKKKVKIDKIDKDKSQMIINDYINDLASLKDLSKKYNLSASAIRNFLKKNKIDIRSASESSVIVREKKRKYTYDACFFKNQNATMAYIAGFIAADGSIAKKTNRIKITLSKIDVEFLEKIKELLKFSGNVKTAINSSGFEIATLEIYSKEYKQDLSKLNIVPNKTFVFKISNNLEKQYWIDFIRGYWDGDGTICTAGKSIRSSLCSANKEFLEQVLEFFEKEYKIPKVNIYVRKGITPLYYFQYSKNSTKKLFKAFYSSKHDIYLKRKFEKFKELCIENKTHETAHPTDEGEKVR